MTKLTMHALRQVARERPYSGHSDAYRWLRTRHASFALLFAKHQPRWADIADRMTAAGIKGGRDKRLTARAVRRIWETVCRDVAAAAPRKPVQRAGPPGWTPTPFAPPPAKVPAAPATAGPVGEVDEQIAATMAELARRSGR